MEHSHEHHNHDLKKEYTKFAVVILTIAILTLIQGINLEITAQNIMTGFMGYFFIFFGLFKLLAYKDFREAYATYDIVAKRFTSYAYIYPFIELGLGAAYLLSFELIALNIVTVFIMGISTIGVMRSLGKNFKCACLGTIIDLPLSNITLIEDLGMGIMALLSLALLIT